MLPESFVYNEPEYLFHYTSATGLLGILKCGKIRVTKIHYLNDKSELQLAFDYIRDEIDQQKRGIGKTRSDEDLDKMAASLDFNASTNLCVASFTAVDDQLSQWRGYCEIGKGYSLGFNFDKLRKLVASQPGWELVPCIYSERQHKQIAKYLVDNYPTKEMLKSSQDRLQVQPNSLPAFIDSFSSKAMSLAPRIKSEAFQEEEEWRLITPILDYANAMFREGNHSLIPYWEFDLDFPIQARV